MPSNVWSEQSFSMIAVIGMRFPKQQDTGAVIEYHSNIANFSGDGFDAPGKQCQSVGRKQQVEHLPARAACFDNRS
jgi:hypothetical protein